MSQGKSVTAIRLKNQPSGHFANPVDGVVTFLDAANKYLHKTRAKLVATDRLEFVGELPAGATKCQFIGGSLNLVSEIASGRVYGMEKNNPHIRFGAGVRLFTATGEEVSGHHKVFRIEFDEDADEGMATVSLYLTDAGGNILVDYERNEPLSAVVRLWVRAVLTGQPVPEKTPDAVLYKQGGKIVRFERDPLPDAAIEHMGGKVQKEIK